MLSSPFPLFLIKPWIVFLSALWAVMDLQCSVGSYIHRFFLFVCLFFSPFPSWAGLFVVLPPLHCSSIPVISTSGMAQAPFILLIGINVFISCNPCTPPSRFPPVPLCAPSPPPPSLPPPLPVCLSTFCRFRFLVRWRLPAPPRVAPAPPTVSAASLSLSAPAMHTHPILSVWGGGGGGQGDHRPAAGGIYYNSKR